LLPLKPTIPHHTSRWPAGTGSYLCRHEGGYRAGTGITGRIGVIWSRRHFVAACGLTCLSGCGRSEEKVIGVVPKATSHLFFIAVHSGVDRAARDLHLNVEWNGPQNETDYARQIQIVDSMITQQVAALAISAADENALVSPIERAIQAGIPVTVFDSAAAVTDYVSFIATDNYGAGRTAARLLSQLIGGSGKVAMVMQKPGGTSTVLRESGFDETTLKQIPGMQIVARQFGMADAARSRAVAEDILTAHPDVAGIFASSEAATLGAIQAIRNRSLSGKVRLVGFDTSKAHVEALRDGTMSAMLVQDSFRLGYEAVKSLSDKLKGKTPQKRIEIPAHVVFKDDLNKPEIRQLVLPDALQS
jgi:ribose transport system substrate-binding protein